MPSQADDWAKNKDDINARISNIKRYVNEGTLSANINSAKSNLKTYILSSGKDKAHYDDFLVSHEAINSALNDLNYVHKTLTDILGSNETVSAATKLKEIGDLQQDIIDKKAKLKAAKNELDIANTRQKMIKGRDKESSYAQTFGYIFRPFRRMSYTIIVPLILALFLTGLFIIWTTKYPSSITGMPVASAPPLNNLLKNIRKNILIK
jgi:hypothetical protein